MIPTICLNMIVKNESKTLPKCFESIKDIISYYVISDTGSEDGTPELIKEIMDGYNIKGEVHHHKWENFGVNRQLALEPAIGKADYALILDADGNLQNRDEVIKALTDNLIILDEDGNIQNKDEVIEALREGAEETKLAALLLENAGITSTLYFSYDDSEIDEVATRIIIQHANFMQSNPSFNLRLEGHADERGTREYNLALGENRALNVKEVLGLYNLEDRIVVVSYGEEQPILTGSNEEAWEKNRRVEFSYY